MHPALNAVLALAAVALIVAGALTAGPPSTSSTVTRQVTAERGVVQSTVSGSGTIQSPQQINVSFKSGGRLAHLFVAPGQHVRQGDALAQLDPADALDGVAAARAGVASARAHLEMTKEGLSPQEIAQNDVALGQGRIEIASARRALALARRSVGSDTASSRAAVASARTALARSGQAAAADRASQADQISAARGQQAFDQQTLAADQAQLQSDQAQLQTDQSQPTSNQQQQAVAADNSKISSDNSKISSDQAKLLQDATAISSARDAQATGAIKDQQALDAARSALSTAQLTQRANALKDQQSVQQARAAYATAQHALDATVAGNAVKGQGPKPGDLAVAETGVQTAQVSLHTAEQALAEATLRSPADGTVGTISGRVGEFVSGGGGGASGASSGAGATSPTSSSGAGASSTSGSSSAASASGGSSSGFIVLTALHGLQLVVPFSESDAVKVSPGQPATVTVDALPGQELGAHVIEVAPVSTTNSGVVSYNVTLQLDQSASGLRPGMTASAQVVVAQAEGAVTISPAALSRSGGQQTVTVLRAGRKVVQPVVVGVRGDNAVEILAGLEPSDRVLITSTTFASAAATGGLRSGATGVGGGGPGGGFGGGGGGGGLGRAFGG